MKALTIIVMLACVAGLSVPAAASEYTVGFFTDESASSCEISNVEQEIITIHMLLYGDAETGNTVGFFAPTPECWTGAVWLGDEINDQYLFLGSSHSETYGLTVTFTGCRTLPVRLGSMSFWAGGSEPCCTYKAYPVPNGRDQDIQVVTCGGNLAQATHESVIINPDPSCGCVASSVVATEPTTWGRVKALYQ